MNGRQIVNPPHQDSWSKAPYAMALTINTNIPSPTAQRHLALSGTVLSTTMQRLSSGLRVNSAKDDAAGLAISERMNTQVRGMAVARRNANDGISLAQTAEGAMQKLTDILQRSRELAVQAINGTNSTSDRQALDSERAQLLQEFSRIVSTSSFNGQKLIDGSFMAQSFQVGANAGEVIGMNLPSLQTPDLGAALWAGSSDRRFSRGNNGFPAGDLVLRGTAVPVAQNESVTSIAKKVNSAALEPKIYAEVGGTSAWVMFGTPATWPVDVTLKLANGDASKVQTVTFAWNPNDPSAVQNTIQAINAVSAQTGIRAADVNRYGYVQLVNDTEEIRLLNDSAPSVNMAVAEWNQQNDAFSGWIDASGSGGSGTFGGPNDVLVNGALTLISEDEFRVNGGYYDQDDNQVGPFPGTADSRRIGRLSDAKLTTAAEASRALIIYDAAIKQVSRARADVGAMQSRFESVVSNLGIAEENTAAARGRIVDADYAVETANLSRAQILQQAGTAMLAQANQIPHSVLQLLKS